MVQKHRAKPVTGKTVTGRLGAVCVLAVLCLPASVAMLAQSDASSNASSTDKTSGTKTANPKKQAKAAPSASKTTSSSTRKTHPVAHSGTTVAHNTKHTSLGKNGKKKTTARGQQKIDSQRAEAIQEALIREHYMNGEPTGSWNQSCEDAMRKYQADHGWQSKQVPDSRALISLGLGPSHDHLLNPDSAMTTGPDISHAASVTAASQSPVSNSAEPGARINANPTPTNDSAPVATGHDAPSPQ